MDWHPIQGGSCDTASRSIIKDSWMDGIGCDTWLEHGLNVIYLRNRCIQLISRDINVERKFPSLSSRYSRE